MWASEIRNGQMSRGTGRGKLTARAEPNGMVLGVSRGFGAQGAVVVIAFDLRDDAAKHGLVLVKWAEARFEASDDQALDVLERDAHFRVHEPELFRHGRVGDQAVVRVDRDAQPEIEIE